MADVRTNVALSLITDFTNFTELTPSIPTQALDTLLDQVVAWSLALAPSPAGAASRRVGVTSPASGWSPFRMEES